MIITPNDHYKNDIPNKNVQILRENIMKISQELDVPIWDFYTVMGGEGSMNEWYKNGLTGNDKIHFKKKGYEVQGELFVNALIQLIEN
jgi:lysophospholipase L1-like esterase